MPPSLALVVLVYVSSGGPAVGRATTDGDARARIVEVLRRGGAELVSPAVDRALEARRQGWRAAAELAFFTRGRVALERGRHARERVELEEAARVLGEAEASYAEGLASPGAASLMAEAALERGLALAELGHADEARAEFRRALALSPGLSLTERVARPDVVRLFKEVASAPAKAALSRRFTVAGEVTSPEVQLHFDGHALPPGEMSAPLSPGLHLVRVERDGAAVARLLELDEQNGIAIDLPAPRDVVVERIAALRTAPSEDGVRALIEALDVGAAVVGVVAGDGRRVLISRVGPECSTQQIEIDASSEDAVRRGLTLLDTETCRHGTRLALRLDDPRLAPVVTVSVAPSIKPRRRVWPWIFAGALGVTAAVVGVTAGVLAADPRYSLHVDGRGFGAR